MRQAATLVLDLMSYMRCCSIISVLWLRTDLWLAWWRHAAAGQLLPVKALRTYTDAVTLLVRSRTNATEGCYSPGTRLSGAVCVS